MQYMSAPEGSGYVILTQRLCESGQWTVVKDIMDLVLQVHYSCKGTVATIAALVAQGCISSSFRCPEPHGQRPVQSNVQHVKPERPVGLTSEACDVISRESAGGSSSPGPGWHLFGF